MSKRYFLIFFTAFKRAVSCFKLPFYSLQKYLKYNTLGLILACVSVVSPGFKMSTESSIENCKDFDVKLTITHTSNGQKNGEVIMEYSIHDALKAGVTRIVFVIREDFQDAFREALLSRPESPRSFSA